VAVGRILLHIGLMADLEFRYRLNPQTGRWDVVRRWPDGTELVIQSYDLPDEAMSEVSRLTKRPPGPPSSS